MSLEYDVYDRRFGPNFFSVASACRLCVLQKEHHELTKIIYVLQEFVTANVGILSPFSTVQLKSYAAIAAMKKNI